MTSQQLPMGIDGVDSPRTGNTRADRVLGQLEEAWNAFRAAWEDLDDETLLVPGVTGEWSIRDLIAHVTWWDEESIRHLPEVLEGVRPAKYSDLYGGIDAFNALMTERKSGLSLDQVRREFAGTHERLVAYLVGLDPERWVGDQRFRKRLKLDTWGHYPIHTEDIRRWQERAGR